MCAGRARSDCSGVPMEDHVLLTEGGWEGPTTLVPGLMRLWQQNLAPRVSRSSQASGGPARDSSQRHSACRKLASLIRRLMVEIC